MKYINVIPPRENVSRELGRVSLGYNTGNKSDHTIAEKDQSCGAQVLNNCEWFSAELSSFIKSTTFVMQESISAASFLRRYHEFLDGSTLTDFYQSYG